MAKPSSVVVKFRGATKALDKAVRHSQKQLTGMQKAGRAANLAAAAGIAAIGGIMISGARQFDTAQSIIQNATGKTGEDLKGLTDEFQDVFSNVNKSSEQVATAIGALDTLVAGTDDQIGKLTYRLEGLSDVIGGDFVSNAEKWGRIANLWGINADKASDSLDTLTYAGQAYGISGDELMTRLQKHGETFKVLGLDVDEAALALGELYAKGADMRTLASGFEIMAGKAIELGQDPAAAFKDLTQRIRDAETATDALAIATEEYAMGDKAAIAYVDVVRDGIDITRDYNQVISDNEGLLKDQIEANKSVSEKIEEMKNKVLVLGMKLAECLMPHFEKLIDWMSEDGNLRKAIIGISATIGLIYSAKAIAGVAGMIAKIKALGATATAAAGTAAVAGSGAAAVATGTGLALIIAKLGIIAGIAAAGFTIFFLIKWLSDPMTPEQEAVRDRVFGRGQFTPPQIGAGPVSTSPSDPGLFWRPPEGPGGMVPGAGQATTSLGALGRTGRGFFYPQGGAPQPEPEPVRTGPSDHPAGRTGTPQPRSGPVPTGADTPMRGHPGQDAGRLDEFLPSDRPTGPGSMIPAMAEGGIVDEPTLAVIGEAGPEAVVPLNKGYPQIVVNVYPQNLMGNKDQLIRDIQEGLNEAYRRNPAGNFRFAPPKRF